MNKLVVCIAILALSGCAGTNVADCPPPAIKTQTVNIATPVPCPAFAKLGQEPSYADSDAALAIAPDIFEASKLLLAGRIQRAQRLAAYAAARVACTF